MWKCKNLEIWKKNEKKSIEFAKKVSVLIPILKLEHGFDRTLDPGFGGSENRNSNRQCTGSSFSEWFILL